MSAGSSAWPSGISGVGHHQIRPYDPSWPGRAAELIARLHDVLGDAAVRIEHIGSTAVPGLASRPIPDIQVSVEDVGARHRFEPPLVDAGYVHFPFAELVVDDYLVYVPADGSNTEHIEVCEAGSLHERRHLAVRDYLRAHPDEALAYEAVKRRAADRAEGQRERYSAAKNTFVQLLEGKSLRWYGTPSASRRPATLVFDGRCRFCRDCVEWVQAHLRTDAVVDFVPLQAAAETGISGISPEALAAAAWWFDPDGRAYRGPYAIGRALEHCDGAWPAVGRFSTTWPVRYLSEAVYELVATHRGALDGWIPHRRRPPKDV